MRLRVKDATVEEMHRKQMVKQVLASFSDSLKKMVDPAIAQREAGASMESIKNMIKNNFRLPESDKKKEPETPALPLESSVREPSDAFITDKINMDGPEPDEALQAIEDQDDELDDK